MESLAGAVLDQKYLLLRMLGEGGMGAVYEAEELGKSRRVAVKLLSTRLEDPKARDRFELEARALSGLRHPNLVRVTDYSSRRDNPFFVMELAPGKNLAEIVLRDGPLDPTRVARIALQMLGALAAAHARGIVHRDVKPHNVQVDGSLLGDDVKLLDFGLAKDLDKAPNHNLTQEGTVVGTLHYMAPEQARSQHVDARADVYAVGACMYFALTGRRMFEGAGGMSLYRAVIADEPAPLRILRPELPDALCAIVHRALAKNRDQRLSSAHEMADALQRWLRATRKSTLASSVPVGTPAAMPTPRADAWKRTTPLPSSSRSNPNATARLAAVQLPPSPSQSWPPAQVRVPTIPPSSFRTTPMPMAMMHATPVPASDRPTPAPPTMPSARKQHSSRVRAFAILATVACLFVAVGAGAVVKLGGPAQARAALIKR